MNAGSFTARFLEHKKKFDLLDETAFAAVSDGKLELHEVEALLGCLHIMQTDIGKLIYRLQQAKTVLSSREGIPTRVEDPVAPTPLGEGHHE